MGRIAEEEIERLKREVSLERLAEARGVQLKRHGADLIGLCPFHEDHSPSLVISPKKNLWNCLGACRRGGDVIEWVMRAEGVSFRHAVELLREEHLPLAASSRAVKSSSVVKLPAPVERDADDRELLLQVAGYYHETLKQTPEALKYLEARGLKSTEMIERFQLGFANRTLGYRLPRSNRVTGAELRGRLQKVGIIRESGHEHFNGSIVIPIFDASSQVVQMYGRKITAGLREGTPLHLYLPGAHRGVWNEEALAASKEIILCEALIDALTLWCAGFRYVTASYGVNGFTDDHRAAFKKHGTKRIYIAYDRDDAGEGAAQSLAEELLAMGMECFRVQFPKGMDANEYALKVQPAAKSLGILLNKAEWLGKGQRPTVAVSEEKIEEAAKEKTTDSIEANTEEEKNLPLVVEAKEPLPTAAAMGETSLEIETGTIWVTRGERRYRVLGMEKNTSMGALRVNVLVSREEKFHVDTLDLYSARQRVAFAKQAGEGLGIKEEVVGHDLGRVLLRLEELQREQLQRTLEAKPQEVALSEEEKAAAFELLRDPKLLDRILADFERCGVVGEETNKLTSYLAVVSRLLEAPLAILVQSSSAAGKSALMEAVLALLPEEQQVQYSAMTGQSLFYMGESDLKHKVLAIVEEEGALRAAYALKLLQSEGVLTIASTGKDATTGRLVTHQYRVEGPVMLFLTTTAIDLDEELMNRCLVLTVNEDRKQTQAIHRKQREAQTIEGLLARQDREEILRVHRNAQRLLQPLFVANPYARELTFLDSQTRTRRDHMKYLTLMRSIALLHQHQRPRKTLLHRGQTVEYIEVTKDDIRIANQLTEEVLGRSLDELPPQTRRLLVLVDEMVGEQCQQLKMERGDFRFSRREVRQRTGWGDTQLRVHLGRLEELEYLLVHRGGRGQSFVYELVFERRETSGKPVLAGLIDAEKLPSYNYDEKNAGQNGEFAGSTRPPNGGIAGGARGEESPALARRNGNLTRNLEKLTTREAGGNHIVRTVSGVR
ncbi:MAG TPA: CHC2 zinc finger domain-containing protein [Candidatus Sulfotelmatobacter sp.]